MTLRLRSGRAPKPCFEQNKRLLAAAERAEERKNQAIDRFMGRLGPKGAFEQAMQDVIDADRRALKEKGK
jgi:hypothetical protein